MMRYWREHAVLMAAAAVLSLLSGLMSMQMLSCTNRLAAAGVDGASNALLGAGALLLALLLVNVLMQTLLARLGAALVEKLRNQLAHQFLGIDYEKLANRGHLIFGAMIQDLERIGPLVMLAPQLANNAVLLLLGSGYLIRLSPQLYCAFLLVMAAVWLGSFVTMRLMRSSFDAMRAAEEQFFGHLRTIADGKRDLVLSRTRSAHFSEHLLRPSMRQARIWMTRVHLIQGLNESWSLVTVNATLFLMVLAGYRVLHLSTAIIVQFVVAALFLTGPLNFVVQMMPHAGLGLSSIRHLRRIGLDLQSALPQRPREATLTATDWQSIQVNKVVYRYPAVAGSDAGLGVGPVDFTIRRNETVFRATATCSAARSMKGSCSATCSTPLVARRTTVRSTSCSFASD
jgi:ABC-type siderophore export system fused ATPase/permease subunit